MKRNLYLNIIVVLFLFIQVLMISSCVKKDCYQITFKVDDEIVNQIEVSDSFDQTKITNPEKEGYVFLGWYNGDELFDFTSSIDQDYELTAKFELKKIVSFKLSYNEKDYTVGEEIKVKLTFDENSETPEIKWTIYDNNIGTIRSSKKNLCTISLTSPGELIIQAEAIGDIEYSQNIKVTINKEKYNIAYDLKGVDDVIFETEKLEYYYEDSFPITLPKLKSESYYFLGWKINSSDKIYQTINQNEFELNELRLQACFVYPEIIIKNDLYQILKPSGKYQISLSNNFNESSTIDDYQISITDSSIVSFENGWIVGQKVGTTTIKIKYLDVELSETEFGISVVDEKLYDSNDFKTVISKMNLNPFYQNIMVYGWQKKYNFDMYESISKYLFEDFEVIENIAPIKNTNRPGTKSTKYYICVHDTGDADYTAKEWSDTVYNYFNKQTNSKYDASFQYVVGNDGTYHNIPDDEVSWHAGDGTKNPYKLTKTGVFGTNKKPQVGISTDGFYTIDNQKTTIKAPTNGNEILQTKDINDAGIKVAIGENNEYLIGNTYFNTSYYKISNYGGNINSIGIESCINYGSDIYYTWQKLAKLVANLMYQNDLTIDDVVPHHYFSGKNCPQTMRESNRWDYFKSLICDEYDMLLLLNKGITLSISTESNLINNLGRVLAQPKENTMINYNLNIHIDDKDYCVPLYATLPGSNNNGINN